MSAQAPHVLLVEDDPDLRLVMAEVLAMHGIRTELAAHGLEAMDRLSRGPLPRLILLDLMMPMMDGFEFRAAQRAMPGLADIPVVVLSSDPDVERRRDELQARCCLRKPVELPALLALIERWIR